MITNKLMKNKEKISAIPEKIQKLLDDLYFDLSNEELNGKQKYGIAYQLDTIRVDLLYDLFPKEERMLKASELWGMQVDI